jgi:polyisoprenoid-binding protein YceI
MAEIPGYVAGTWDIDPVHSEVGFTVRHFGVSKVRGRFDKFEGTVVTGEDALSSTVTASIDATSINTNNEQRDAHIKSGDFFEVEAHPTWSFTTTGVKPDGEDYILDGELTIRGTTKPVSLALEISGFGTDPYGGTRAGFSAKGEIDRHDFGVSFGGVEGAVVSNNVQISLEIEAVLRQG